MVDLEIRPGSIDDEDSVMSLFDEAVAWLVGRGLVGQWGEQPFSERPEMRTIVREILDENAVRIAEHDQNVVGVVAAGASPPYVPGNPMPEIYITLLLSARRLAGNRIGSRLLGVADEIARERGASVVRVDCWADSPGLVGYYERHGFSRDGRFDLRGWRGQILSKEL